MVHNVQALELMPHLWNNDDLWKKIEHFKHWKSPHSYHVVLILAEKSSCQYRYLEGFKWPVLWNLSLIYIIMVIYEKKNHHFKNWNTLSRYPIVIFKMWLLFGELLFQDNIVAVGQFPVVKVPNYFGHIIIIISKVIQIFEIPKFAFYHLWLSRI